MRQVKTKNGVSLGAVMPAVLEDMPEILALQQLCYQSEAELHDDFTIPPHIQTLAEIRVEFSQQKFLKVSSGEMIVGSVRAFQDAGTCHIGHLIVHPDFQNRGIGTTLLLAIEAQFPNAKRYELFTEHKSVKNLHLYQARGYQIFKTEEVNAKLKLVFLEKLPNPC